MVNESLIVTSLWPCLLLLVTLYLVVVHKFFLRLLKADVFCCILILFVMGYLILHRLRGDLMIPPENQGKDGFWLKPVER